MELLTKKEQAIIAELAPVLWYSHRCNRDWTERIRRSSTERFLGLHNLHWLLIGKPYMCASVAGSPTSSAVWEHYTVHIGDLQLPVSGAKTLMHVWDAALTFNAGVFYKRMYLPNKTLLNGMLPNPDVWEGLPHERA